MRFPRRSPSAQPKSRRRTDSSARSGKLPPGPAAAYTRDNITPIQQGRCYMGKMRHIALIVPDPEASAKFFEEAFDLKRAGTARRGIYLSDGVINVALLKQEGNEKVGLYHFGMWVDDLDAAEKKVVDAGGT